MIHVTFRCFKNDYINAIYSIIPNQDFYTLGLFKDNHSKELNFPTLFLWASTRPNYF